MAALSHHTIGCPPGPSTSMVESDLNSKELGGRRKV